MSGVLIDTHILIWMRGDPPRINERERRAIRDAKSCFVSIVSFWEIGLLFSAGRLRPDPKLMVPPAGIKLLPIEPAHCLDLMELPPIHRDPFDRMLISQARTDGLTLISRDAAISRYAQTGVVNVLPT